MNDQNTLYVARLHWLLFLWPILLTLGGLIIGIKWIDVKEISLGLVILGLIWGFGTWLNYHFSSLTIEKKRVIFRTGILIRKITDIPVAKIESIDIRQSILGSIMRYGALTVTGTGGTRHLINYVQSPLTCRRYIEQIMQENESVQ